MPLLLYKTYLCGTHCTEYKENERGKGHAEAREQLEAGGLPSKPEALAEQKRKKTSIVKL